MTGCYEECCFGVMYGQWYGISVFVVFSVAEICVVYGVVCVVVCCLLCVLGVWGVVIFVLFVMRVVRGVPLLVVCVFPRVDVVCLCLLWTHLLF